MQYHFAPAHLQNEDVTDLYGREGVFTSVYRDGSGNLLNIYETEADDLTIESPDVQGFLDDVGYDGDGHWELVQ